MKVDGQSPPENTGAQARWLLLVWAAAMALYCETLAPTIFAGDAAEIAAAGATWGIPHPPGYPFYSLLANIWVRIVPLGDPAWRLNLLSALFAASAMLLLASWLMQETRTRGVAILVALSLAVGRSFWGQALISEVYAFDIFLLAATLLAAQRLALSSSRRALFLFGLVGGAWLAHRPVNLLYLPAALLIAWPAWKSAEIAGRRAASGLALMLGALLPAVVLLAYPPLASSQQPLVDSLDPESWSRLWELLSASVYRRYLFAGSPLEQGAHLLAALPRELGLLLPLAFLGVFILWRRRRRVTLALIYLVFANALFVLTYGVPDVLVFTLPGAFGVAALAGLAAGALWRHGSRALRRGLVILSSIALLLVLALNYQGNDLSRQHLARHFARDALDLPVAKALVLSHVDTVTFSLWYAQAVEGHRADLEVVSRGRAVPWYQDQVRARRPDLVIPSYEGADAASHWPALLVRENRGRARVYLTSDLRGYFSGRDLQRLGREVQEIPAGLLVELAPRDRVVDTAQVVARNERFWARAWPHATAARRLALETDMTAVLLHYGSMRLLYGRYCALHGRVEEAALAAKAVVDLDTAPLIARVNRDFARQRARYHLSQMPQLAAELAALCVAVAEGRLSRRGLSQQLVGRRARSASSRGMALSKAAAPGSRPAVPRRGSPGSPLAERFNQQGIALGRGGQLVKALDLFGQALKEDANHHGARFNHAKVLAALGRKEEARRSYGELLRRAPHYTLGLVGLAELERGRDDKAALELYRRAQKSPGYQRLRALIDRRLVELGGGRSE